MSTAAQNTGSTTAPAAVAATLQAPAPTVAAPPTAPPAPIPAPHAPNKKSYAPRQNMPTEVTGPNGLSTMLQAVADMHLSVNSDLRVANYVVPDTTFFFQVLGMLDTQMSRTKRFTDANPDWHPFVSQLYFSILIYHHVLKTQKVGNQISYEQSTFLDYLDDVYQISHAKIPGPLVPFFQSLAANSGPNDHYGNVTFGIPDNLNATQDNHYQADARMNTILPSVIFVLDQFMRLINRFAPVGAVPAATTLSVTDSHYVDIFGIPANIAAPNTECLKTPTARTEINVSLSVMQGFFGTTNLWRTVLPFSVATNESHYTAGNSQRILSFDQYIGFRGSTAATAATNYTWFREVGRIMQPYSDFFRDSVSLGAINTSGIGSIYIETRFLDTDQNMIALTGPVATRNVRYQPAGTVRYVIPDVTDLTVTYVNRETGLDLVADQMGILCAFNTQWDVNNNVGTAFPGPFVGNTRIGPVWQRNAEYVSNVQQPLRHYANIISGYYHVPAAGKFGN